MFTNPVLLSVGNTLAGNTNPVLPSVVNTLGGSMPSASSASVVRSGGGGHKSTDRRTVPIDTSSARSLAEMEDQDVTEIADTYGDDSLAKQLEISRDYNAAEAEKAYNRQIEWLENYYPRLVKSMKDAGLNPILAANLGFSGSSAVQASSSAVGGDTYADLINAASNRRNSSSQRISAISSVLGAAASVVKSVGSILNALR